MSGRWTASVTKRVLKGIWEIDTWEKPNFKSFIKKTENLKSHARLAWWLSSELETNLVIGVANLLAWFTNTGTIHASWGWLKRSNRLLAWCVWFVGCTVKSVRECFVLGNTSKEQYVIDGVTAVRKTRVPFLLVLGTRPVISTCWRVTSPARKVPGDDVITSCPRVTKSFLPLNHFGRLKIQYNYWPHVTRHKYQKGVLLSTFQHRTRHTKRHWICGARALGNRRIQHHRLSRQVGIWPTTEYLCSDDFIADWELNEKKFPLWLRCWTQFKAAILQYCV